MTQQELDTESVVNRFNDAFNRHSVDEVMSLMTNDCVFESTGPAPDGQRHVGQTAVRTCWTELFAGAPQAHFSGRGNVRCRGSLHGSLAIRLGRWPHTGVDVLRVCDGKVAEK
jgi:ketosteroid isomerase-like protein